MVLRFLGNQVKDAYWIYVTVYLCVWVGGHSGLLTLWVPQRAE